MQFEDSSRVPSVHILPVTYEQRKPDLDFVVKITQEIQVSSSE